MQKTPPFILIDGSSYLYRAFHALPPLVNSQGQPTGAIYGVLSMIRKLLADYAPQHIAVVFDPPGKTTRDAIYPAYKAQRPPTPDALRLQVTPLFAAIRAMGLPLVQIEGIEADDVIATLAIQATQQGYQVVISTGDKDIAQLVNAQITLVNTMTNTCLDTEGVIKKFGVHPEKIIDYLALMGDSSDNIPGVPKVGPKTAVKWLHDYGSLDAIIEKASEFTGKIGENLRASLAYLPLSKQLVTLDCELALPYTMEDLVRKPSDTSALIALYKDLEFKSPLKELLDAEAVSTPTSSSHLYQTIFTTEALDTWLEKLSAHSQFAFDTETTSLDTLVAELVGVSLAIQNEPAIYIPLAHDYIGAPLQLSRSEVLEKLKPFLEDPQKTCIGHNTKYDMGVLANYGMRFSSNLQDTMLESYVLESASSRHNLDGLALKYLGKRCVSFEEVAGKGAKQLTFNQIPIETAGPYAAEDADVTLQLHETLWPKIAETPDFKKVLMEIELPLVPVLSRMERCGVCIDADLLAAQSKELAARIALLEEQAYQLAGEVFNLSSPKQLQTILYTQLKLPVLEKTPTNAPSTAESVLQELAQTYPLPKIILEHRSMSKLKSTYTDSLPRQIHPKTGRIHTSYNQAVTSTGRLSSTNPNLQNIPIKNAEGRRIRRAFIAPPGYKIISADYSQIELRIMAHLSQDPGLCQAFAENLDIHTATASEVFSVPLDAVSAEQRRHAKAINFGLIYGMSAFGLAKQLGIERDVAQTYINQYFEKYPGVQTYMESTRVFARAEGYVKTLYGRRLYVPDIQSSQMLRRRAAERAAINAPMQGTAADMIKLAMIALDHALQKSTADAKMIMQVHDELVFEVAEKEVEISIPLIREKMTQVMPLSVPLEVHICVGNNWEEAHA
jgi:DNA polymerase-1